MPPRHKGDGSTSFNLLFLIEAGRPSLRLTDEFYGKSRFWVIPVDTVRAAKKFGIIDKVTYRPSRATKILRIAGRLDDDLVRTGFAVAEAKLPARDVLSADLKTDQKREVLDLSAELTQYRFSKRKLEKDAYEKQFLDILASRSTLGSAPADPAPVARPVRPDEGHHSGRFRLGGGYRTDQWFTELEWRAAYHELADFDEGYVRGAQINFFELGARYDPDKGSLMLGKLHIVDILSLAPRDRFFSPVSWKFSAGFDRVIMKSGNEQLVFRVNPRRLARSWL